MTQSRLSFQAACERLRMAVQVVGFARDRCIVLLVGANHSQCDNARRLIDGNNFVLAITREHLLIDREQQSNPGIHDTAACLTDFEL